MCSVDALDYTRDCIAVGFAERVPDGSAQHGALSDAVKLRVVC